MSSIIGTINSISFGVDLNATVSEIHVNDGNFFDFSVHIWVRCSNDIYKKGMRMN